jgi:membrane protease YdiL (CAAX protease family)
VRAIFGLVRRLFVDSWKDIDDREAEEPAPAPAPTRAEGRRARKRRLAAAAAPSGDGRAAYDLLPVVVLVVVAVSLGLQEYFGERQMFYDLFPEQARGEYGQLKSFAWWSGWRFFGYVVIPVLAILAMPGQRVRDYFISFRGFFRHLPIYVGLYLLVLPVVIIAARTDSFTATYPFYKWSNRSAFDFWTWQALYALQFVSLEFFFRGFMLEGLRRRIGSAAIFVMVVPYTMIHFGKPMAETFGAIIAGVALGTLALRTRSIWGGVLIHIGVALTMDLLALSQCPPEGSGLPCKGH